MRCCVYNRDMIKLKNKRPNSFTFTSEEESIIRIHFGKKSLSQILKLLPRKIAYKYFTQKCREDLGLARDRAHPMPIKYSHNQEYWKKLNLTNVYLAGHLAADGSIIKLGENRYRLTLMISDSDIGIVETYKKELSYTGPTILGKQRCSLRPNSPLNGFCRIDINCFNRNAEYLKQYFNLEPNKTHRIGPTNLTDKYLNFAYLIGYCDGDGTITMCHQKEKGYKSLQFSCVSCSKPIMEWMKDVIDKTFSLTGPYSRYTKLILKGPNLWYFGVSGLRAAVIINYLRQFPVPKLARKWNNPEVLAYIEDKKRQYPELFINPDPVELAKLMPEVVNAENLIPKESLCYIPQINLPLL